MSPSCFVAAIVKLLGSVVALLMLPCATAKNELKIQRFNFPLNVEEGQTIQATCGVLTGNGQMTFHWLKNGLVLTADSEQRISFLNAPRLSVLLINKASTDMSGNYTCVLEGSGQQQTDTHTAQLIVRENKTEVELTNSIDYTLGSDGSLQIDSVGPEDSGYYTCRVYNGIGHPINKTIQLQVKEWPVIQPFNFPNNVTSGQDLRVICTVTQGGRPLTFKWLKDGREIVALSHVHVQSFDDFSLLNIKSVDSQHVGNFSCFARNLAGESSFTASLSVYVSPRWRHEPVDTQVALSQEVVLSCSAKGYPAPTITWRRVDQENVVSRRFEVTSNDTLTIPSARPEDAGRYECSATNGVGASALSKVVTLTVHVPVRFEEHFETLTVQRSETAKLICDAIGDNPITVTWTKNKELLSGSSSKHEILENVTEKGTTSQLKINGADRRDSATYGCVAQNKFGKDEKTTNLLVREVPSPPLDIRVDQTWSRSSSISWTPPFSGNSPITKFILQYWRDAGSPHRLEEESVVPSQGASLLKDLQPGTAYVIRVLAENDIGRGLPSESQKFTTKEEEPEGSPTDVWVEARGAGALRVRWKPPPRDQWNGELRGYYIGFKVHGSEEPFAYKTVDYGIRPEEEYVLTGLLKSTTYSVVLKAFNNAGGGPSSQEVVATTPDTDPPSAPTLWVESQSPTTVGLKWEQRTTGHTPVTHYTLHYREEGGPWSDLTLPSNPDRKYLMTGLHEGTRYQMYLTAVSESGQSDPSDTVAVRTEGGALADSSSSVNGHPGVAHRGQVPYYLQLQVVIPVAASLAIIVLVITGACLYVKRERKRFRAVLAMRMSEKRSSYGLNGTLPHRYAPDGEKSKPLLLHRQTALPPMPPPEGYPAPYATLPLNRTTMEKRRLSGDNRHPSRASLINQGTLRKSAPSGAGISQESAIVVHHYDVAA